jgi:dienelactone hydrolase
VKESACQFGTFRQLAGIVTEPEGSERGPACVLINAGLIPKFGPFRLYAQLARRLAREGIRTLRFDLGDIGDSRPEHVDCPIQVRTEREIRAAVDYLVERAKPSGIVVGGLCSGAEDAFRYAAEDPRVSEVVVIDPFGFRTPGWIWHHLRYRLRRRILRSLSLYSPLERSASENHVSVVNYQYMEAEEARRILRILLDRGVRVHFIYTGGSVAFNHAGQLGAMFPELDFRGLVTLDHFPHADHTQAFAEDRRQVIEAISRRLVR